MNRKIINIAALIALSATLTNCQSAEQKQAEQQVMNQYLKSSKSLESKTTTKDDDLYNLKGCPILLTLGKWRHREIPYSLGGGSAQERDQDWFDGRFVTSTGTGIYYGGREYKSYEIMKDKDWKLIYIGKWQYVPKLDQHVRLLGTQHKASISSPYEIMDETNKKIPEMPLKLIQRTHGGIELCEIKWVHKYGYNAVAETYRQIRPGFWNWLFRNKELIVTGRVVEAEE